MGRPDDSRANGDSASRCVRADDALQYVDSNLPAMLPPIVLPGKWVASEPEARERRQQEVNFYTRASRAWRTGRSWRAGLARRLLSK